MPDREKVIKGLECCTHDIPLSNNVHKTDFCKECPYYYPEYSYCFGLEILMKDSLALLKEQEPKTGHWIESAGNDECSVCGATYSDLYPDYQHTHYCPNCGAKMIVQEVKLVCD